MVIHRGKGLVMTHPSTRQPSTEELDQIRSVNRLFLGFLQDRVRAGQDALGLPAAARKPLLAATGMQLDSIAQFPRALFTLALDGEPAGGVMDLTAAGGTRYAVDLTILLCAWTFSRHHLCQARFLLGLDSRTIQRLRMLQFADLAVHARLPDLLRCAFAADAWFWTELLTLRRAEDRRRLALIALQPEHAGPLTGPAGPR